MSSYMHTLKWYGLLALLSRGAVTLAIVVSSMIMPADQYSLVGLSFAAVMSSSQIFGHPGYLSALKNGGHVGEGGCRVGSSGMPFMAPVGAALGGLYVCAAFGEGLLHGGRHLLLVVAMTAAFANFAQFLNGALQARNYQRFAAINSGVAFGLGLPVSLAAAVLFNASGLFSAFMFSYILVCIRGLGKVGGGRAGFEFANAGYKDFALFSLSGVSASILFAVASRALFDHGGAVEMAAFTVALQVRAATIVISGVIGAEILARYSNLNASRGAIGSEVIAGDVTRITKIAGGVCILVLAGAAFCWYTKLVDYMDVGAVAAMAGAGMLTSLSVPLVRAITVMRSESINTAIGMVSALVSVAMLMCVPEDAVSFAGVFVFNSAAQLVGSYLVLLRSFRQ